MIPFPLVATAAPVTLDGVTFADRPNSLQAPLRQVAKAFHWSVQGDARKSPLRLNGKTIAASDTRRLYDGTLTVSLLSLKKAGATVIWQNSKNPAKLMVKNDTLFVRRGAKRVIVNRPNQQLVALQGARVVLRTPISTGREGFDTPAGTFRTDGVKEKMHLSKQYHMTPMPYAVHVVRGIWLHGGTVVKGKPASHGCIRLPTKGRNAARFLYTWIGKGTPVSVVGAWPRSMKRG